MDDNNISVEELRDRIKSLEKKSKTLARGVTVLGAILVLTLVFVAKKPSEEASTGEIQPAEVVKTQISIEETADIITAKKIQLTDAEGRIRLVINGGTIGSPGLYIQDSSGQGLIHLSGRDDEYGPTFGIGKNNNHAVINLEGGMPALTLINQDRSTSFGFGDTGPIVLYIDNDGDGSYQYEKQL